MTPARPSILPLELRNVGFSADGSTLLQGVRLRIEAGGPTAILGPNGAGKSLLLRLAHGLLEPTAGEVVWTGPGNGSVRERQAMVFDRPVLLRRSVGANLRYGLALRGTTRAEAQQRVTQMLERTGLAPLADRAARVLSAGEQQRLSLARAWLLDPEVLFLDEPTTNLDPHATRRIEAIVAEIAAEGCKVVMTTHDLGQARRLAKDVVFLHGGRLLEHLPAEQFFTQPDSREAAAFIRGELV